MGFLASTGHPYFDHERPLGPHYCVYNRRLMACELDALPTEEGYWLLRTKAALLHTGEWPLEFRGPDAERLLNYLFVNDVSKVKPGRCGYGIACFDDGGLIVDGVFPSVGVGPVLVCAGGCGFRQLGAGACQGDGRDDQ